MIEIVVVVQLFIGLFYQFFFIKQVIVQVLIGQQLVDLSVWLVVMVVVGVGWFLDELVVWLVGVLIDFCVSYLFFEWFIDIFGVLQVVVLDVCCGMCQQFVDILVLYVFVLDWFCLLVVVMVVQQVMKSVVVFNNDFVVEFFVVVVVVLVELCGMFMIYLKMVLV